MTSKKTIDNEKEWFDDQPEVKRGGGTNIGEKGRIRIGRWLTENHAAELPSMTEMGVVNLIYEAGPRQDNGKPYWVSPHSLRRIFEMWDIEYKELVDTRTNRGKEMNSMEFGKAITQLRKRADKLEAKEIGKSHAIEGLEERIDALERICEHQQKAINDLTAVLTDPQNDLLMTRSAPLPRSNGSGKKSHA